jgi:acetylornithine deacetylase/succinyl-diaminopimelate desuccinylase-like protein
MDTQPLQSVLSACAHRFPDTVQRLSDLVRIPSCSFPGYDPAEVERSARAVADWLSDVGLPEVDLVRVSGAHPAVVARDLRAGPDRPTLLLYAHHDVQPPMREAVWDSPAFEPVIRDGRLYGRGAADDKAGIALHAASLQAWYSTTGTLPVNVVVVIEGEEETGSDHLAELLDTIPGLHADAVVIADLANHDTGVPSLTVSLRGLVALEIELRALERPLHSGVWGGPVPDATMGLCRLLASLTDSDGQIAVPGLLEGIEPATDRERADWKSIPFDRELWARQAGIPTASAPSSSERLYEMLWRQPALSVNGIQAGTRGQTGNVLMDAAWARLGVRIVPGMDPARVARLLEEHLRSRTPEGMTLSVQIESMAPAWSTRTEHELFDAARSALELGYGTPPVAIGCGASIPFVEAVTRRLGGAPALLVGVEDPWCNAHSENESVHLGDLLKAIRSQAALFALAAG